MKPTYLLPLLLSFAVIGCKSKPGESGSTESGESPVAEAGATVGGYVLGDSKGGTRAGLVIEMKEVMTMSDGKLSVQSPQGSMEGMTNLSKTKVTKVEGRSEDEVRVEVTAAEEVQSVTMNGNEMPTQSKEQVLVGVPLLVTRKDGVWTAALEDGTPASPAEEVELAAIAKNVDGTRDSLIYGTSARNPGDTWKVDAKDSPWMGEAEDAVGSIQLTFDKVGDYEGEQCAFLSGTFDVTGKPPEAQPGMEGEMKMSGKVSIIRSIKHLQDLSAEMDGAMSMEMTMPGGSMTLSAPMKMVMTTTISK